MSFIPHIIYEDNHLFVIEKPVNMPTQADKSGDLDLLSLSKAFIKERDQKPGNVFLAMVHRLDRVVSGLIVFAKTSKAASRLSEQIRTHKFKKSYLAHVSGTPKKPKATLTHFLKKDSSKNKTDVSLKEKPGYKKAILKYQILEENKVGAILEIDLITGRSHQIRSQLSFIGNPIIGDTKYGFSYSHDKKDKVRGIYLFSAGLYFEHPTTKKPLEFTLNPSWFSV